MLPRASTPHFSDPNFPAHRPGRSCSFDDRCRHIVFVRPRPESLQLTITALSFVNMSQSSLPPWHNTLPSSTDHPGPTLPSTDKGIRICQLIQLKPEALEEYKKVHTEVFEGVLKALRRAGVVGESMATSHERKCLDCSSTTKTILSIISNCPSSPQQLRTHQDKQRTSSWRICGTSIARPWTISRKIWLRSGMIRKRSGGGR
jgi:hypothetical protein